MIGAIFSLGTTAVTTGLSFAQAMKQKKASDAAGAKAAEYMAKARAGLNVNYFDALAIQKEPYELEREALLTQGTLGMQAGVEGDTRGAGATASRIQAAQAQAQAGVRTAMGQELLGLEKLSAEEDARLRDMRASLDLAEVEGAQMAQAQADEARQKAISEGLQGVVSAASQAASLVPLYQNNVKAQKFAASQVESPTTGGSFMDMSNREFKQYMKQNPKIATSMMQNPEYAKQLQNYMQNPAAYKFYSPTTGEDEVNQWMEQNPIYSQIITQNPFSF